MQIVFKRVGFIKLDHYCRYKYTFFCIQLHLFKSIHTQNQRIYWVKYDSALCLFIPRIYNKSNWMMYLSSGIIQRCFVYAPFLYAICLLTLPLCQNIRSNDNVISEYCIWKGVQRVFFLSYPVKGMSSILFLAAQCSFDIFHHLSRLLTLSMASVRLWRLWMWSSSISSVSPHNGHIWESFDAFTFIVAGGSHVRCWGDSWQPKHLLDGSLFSSIMERNGRGLKTDIIQLFI